VGSYRGTATILAEDGSVFDDVAVELVSPDEPVGDERWFGTIKGDFDAFALMEGSSRLRLEDGHEVEFRLSRTDLVVARAGVEIIGLDDPPF
jgi:hypothetical protein